MKKRIQISLPEYKYRKAKQILTAGNMSWQSWGVAAVDKILSESTDDFGLPLPLLEMAIDREQFETKIQEKLVGILRESAFVLLAKANNQTKWVGHKETEVERLFLEMTDVFDYKITGKWNKQRAALQAIDYYYDKLNVFVTKAKNQYLKYYKTPALKNISTKELSNVLDQAKKEIINLG